MPRQECLCYVKKQNAGVGFVADRLPSAGCLQWTGYPHRQECLCYVKKQNAIGVLGYRYNSYIT
jgi:hypothetical protein